MQIHMQNRNDLTYEALFDDLIRTSFGFSFKPWFEQKLWDKRYESYSVIENGKMLSNICIYKVDLLVMGKLTRAHQFGGVTTRAEARGKGYSRMLMEHIESEYPDTPAFLSANPSVIDFYPRFGFRQVPRSKPFLEVCIDNSPGEAVRLSSCDPFAIEMIHSRGAYSGVLDAVNTQPIARFHLLIDYEDGIYHLPKCGAIAIAEQREDTLFLADVIAREPIPFEAVARELPFEGIRRVEFGFCPDWLGVAPEWEHVEMVSDPDPGFIRGDIELPGESCFPTLMIT